MTRFKDTDDLDHDSLASIGGAMGTWPFRTLWYLCRWERTEQTDPAVIRALQAENLNHLADLTRLARDHGIDTATLVSRRRALSESTVPEIRAAISEAYRDEYGSMQECPYEREGSDMACHRCPVPGRAIKQLSDEPDAEPRTQEPDT